APAGRRPPGFLIDAFLIDAKARIPRCCAAANDVMGPGADSPLFIGLDNASNAVQKANLNAPVRPECHGAHGVTDSRYAEHTRFQSTDCERAIVSSELQIMGHIISAAATGLVLQCFVLFGSAPSAFAQSTVTAQNTTSFGETLWVTTTQ